MRRLFSKLFILLFGVIFIGVGIFIGKMNKAKEENNTIEVTGTLVEYEVEKTTDADGDTSTAYFPIFSFTYNGKEYTERYSVGGQKKYTQGAEVTLLINPEFPEDYLIKGDNSLKLMTYIPIAGGVLILLFGLLGGGRGRRYR